MRTSWIAIIPLAPLAGCTVEPAPTPYQGAVTRSGPGYSEQQVSDDTFYVKFAASTRTPERVVHEYLHRRAAELTLRYGFEYFAVIRGPRQPTHLDVVTARWHQDDPRPEPAVVEARTPGTLVLTIQCFKNLPEASDTRLIDAKDYLEKNPKPGR